MNLYIVRHGQCDSNVERIYNYSDDINEVGIKQAEELRDKIKNMNFDIDFTDREEYWNYYS